MSTNMKNGFSQAWVRKTSAYTVIIQDDSGKHFFIKNDAVVFTLPAIAIGDVYTFVNLSDNGKVALTLSPNNQDGITYKGSNTDDYDLINTAATAKKGDFVTIAALNRTDYWAVIAIRGIWAKQT